MAAALAELRTYLRTTIGLGMDAAGLGRANAIIDEGLETMTDLAEFDQDTMKTLCSSVRKPGGTITDPNDPNRVISNPGMNIPSLCENRLCMAAYGAGIYQIVGRIPIMPNSLNRNRLRQLKLHRDMIENHSDPEALPELSKTFGIMKFVDQFPAYLRECKGVSGVPLSYVIRDNAAPPAIEPLALNRPWSAAYTTLSEELIARSPHTGPSFEDDNANVYRLLQDSIKSTSHMSSISRHQRTRNGRQAFLDLQTHNMGNSKWDKVVESAEAMVTVKIWNGKNSRYPLKFHIAKHREAQNDFQRASTHIAYQPPNDSTRVRRLLNSIQCNDQSIVSAKTTVLADATKMNNFEEACDFLLLTAPSSKATGNNSHRISALKNKRRSNREVGSTGVENRYYKSKEFAALRDDQKTELREMRKKSGKGGNAKKVKVSALQKELAEQKELFEQKIAALTTKLESNGGEVPLPPATTNRDPLLPPSELYQRSSRSDGQN